jgi:hypothetical protein
MADPAYCRRTPRIARPRRYYPALILKTFKNIEALAPKFPSRGAYLATAEQIRSGAPAPLHIGAPTEADEICVAVLLADGRVAGTVTRCARMRESEDAARDLRAELARDGGCDVLVLSTADELSGRA